MCATADDQREKSTLNFVEALMMLRNQAGMGADEFRNFIKEEDRVTTILDGLDALIGQHPEIVARDEIHDASFLLTLQAIIASDAGEMERAEDAFFSLDRGYNQSAAEIYRYSGVSYEAAKAYAYTINYGYGEEVQRLQKLLGKSFDTRHKNVEAILKLTSDLEKTIPKDAEIVFFRQIRNQVLVEQSYQKGEEIQLKFDPVFSSWESHDARHLTYISDDEINLDNRKYAQNLSLKSLIECAGGRQVTIDFSYPENIAGQTLELPVTLVTLGGPNGSLAIGLARRGRPQLTPEGYRYQAGRIVLGNPLSLDSMYSFEVELNASKNTLQIRRDVRYIEVYLNGEFIFRTNPQEYVTEFSQLRLKAPWSVLEGRGSVNISNIRIKKWKGPPLNSKNDKIIEYYRNEVKENPKDPWPKFWLGVLFHKDKEYQRAIEQYQSAIDLGIQKSHAAFNVGDAYDRLGEFELADKWYRTSVQEAPGVPVRLSPTNLFSRDTSPEQWARFRLNWHALMSETGVVEDNYFRSVPDQRSLPETHWMVRLFYPQQLAIEGKFKLAHERANRNLKECPDEFKPFVENIIAAYKRGERYSPSEEDSRLYLQVEDSTPLLQFFAHRLMRIIDPRRKNLKLKIKTGRQ